MSVPLRACRSDEAVEHVEGGVVPEKRGSSRRQIGEHAGREEEQRGVGMGRGAQKTSGGPVEPHVVAVDKGDEAVRSACVAPRLRAAAGPAFGWRRTVTATLAPACAAAAAAASAEPSSDPSSTTISSTLCVAEVGVGGGGSIEPRCAGSIGAIVNRDDDGQDGVSHSLS